MATTAFPDTATGTSPTDAADACRDAARMIFHALAGRARRFDELWRRAGWSLWPPRCLICAEPGLDGRDLCGACCAAWPRSGSACVRCAMPLPRVTTLDGGDASRAMPGVASSRSATMRPATGRADCADRPRLAGTASAGCDPSTPVRRGAPHADDPSDPLVPNPALLCGACLRRPTPLDAVHAACLYRSPVDRLLLRFKFHHDLAAGRLLATMMGDAFAPLLDDMASQSHPAPLAIGVVDADSATLTDGPSPGPCIANTVSRAVARGMYQPQAASRVRHQAAATSHDAGVAIPVLVPIPLHRTRLRERGYDQALELARPLARHLDLPLQAQALMRVRDTSAQSRLNASQRRRNLRDAFAWNRDIAMPPHVVLVDDVMTTGATLHSAARALRRAGAVRVDAWVCARVL